MELLIFWYLGGALTLAHLARIITEEVYKTEVVLGAADQNKSFWEMASLREKELAVALLAIAFSGFPVFWLLVLWRNWNWNGKFSFRI